MSLWLTLAAVALVSAILKAAGPALVASRGLSPSTQVVFAHLPPALLAALIAVQTFADADERLVVDARALGLAAAAAALTLRAPALLAVALAATVTALTRMLL